MISFSAPPDRVDVLGSGDRLARACADGSADRARSVGNRPAAGASGARQTKTRGENVPSSFPEELFGRTFAELQGRRRLADYAPDRPARKSNAIVDINVARTAIDAFLATSLSVRREFAIHVLGEA